MISIAQDVIAGLKRTPKRISSRWFYDAKGDALFQKIMKLPEYYLTRAEFSVLSTHSEDIFAPFDQSEPLQLIELGAGDGEKTRILLNCLRDSDRDFTYVPIDISQNALDKLSKALKSEYPNMELLPLQDDYFSALKNPVLHTGARKLIMFLGSNVGNLNELDAVQFYTELNHALKPGDAVLTGFDRVKNPETILAAYNDAQGVTRQFNLNLLARLNSELGANFNVTNWEHQPEYNKERKSALSFLRSKIKQDVYFESENITISFEAGELIHTEMSRKFDLQDIEQLASATGFSIAANFDHTEPLYTDSLWLKKDS
jgi:L-histidine Nalpha-methyltransferase